jgi:imidazolonepropionase-like amidohydrolase
VSGGVLIGTVALVNLGALAPGVLEAPTGEAETLLVREGRIAAVGAASRVGAAAADVIVDCRGTTVIPGLIDSHRHVVLIEDGKAFARPRRFHHSGFAHGAPRPRHGSPLR